MKKLSIAAVKYLNTLPMLRGLQNSPHIDQFELQLGHPKECARKLIAGEVDIALCPVGALIGLEHYNLVSQYGIACFGPVRTVSIYSDVPLQELKVIKLFGESRSSNILAQVLDQKYWKLNLQFVDANADLPDLPTGHLVIGDKCFEMEQKYQHITDLGEAWFKFTGLPFLFACWASIKPIDNKIRYILDRAFASGIADLEGLDLPQNQVHVNLHHYLRDNIYYEINEVTKEGMSKFIKYVDEMQLYLPDVTQTPSGQSI